MRDPAEVTNKLLQIPSFKAALEAGYKKAPRFTLQCPSRHRLDEVTLTADGNGRPWLMSVSEAPGGVVTDSWVTEVEPHGPESLSRIRPRLECRECGYVGVQKQERLLALYAVAVDNAKRSIRLRD